MLVLILGGYLASIYNQLVSLRKRVNQSKQNIDVVLKQRQDELDKLVDAAQKFLDHEDELLSKITEAREEAERADTPTDQANADDMVRDAMSGFRARFEEYPELKSQENMLQLQERISDLENQISDRREFYNEAATRYNTRIRQFPYNIIANMMNFERRELFTATEDEKEDVDIGEAFA